MGAVNALGGVLMLLGRLKGRRSAAFPLFLARAYAAWVSYTAMASRERSLRPKLQDAAVAFHAGLAWELGVILNTLTASLTRSRAGLCAASPARRAAFQSPGGGGSA